MNLSKLNEVLAGEPNYRFQQIKEAIFVDLIELWNLATNLPKALRDKLNKECSLEIKAVAQKSQDNTIKALITLSDNIKVETVLMKQADGRNTVCVSSQAGCPMNCAFCATGQMGFKRNLTADEIVEQVVFFARYLKTDNKQRITNIVYMGMGEPFLNYDNVIESIKILNDPKGFNLGSRHISVSTCGIVPGIKKFSQEKFQVNLAISLHAPNDKLRSQLMPVNRTYPLKQVLKAVDDYIKITNRQVMFEYLLIKGVNDLAMHAKELAKLMKKPLYMVNLIPYNLTGNKFAPAEQSSMERFKRILLEAGVRATLRKSYGQEIKAACGQLAASSH